MHLLTKDGARFAGADAFVEVGRHVWWARPLTAATRLPGVMPLLRRGYNWVAANRYCLNGSCPVPQRRTVGDWIPLLVLPAVAMAFRSRMPEWLQMWSIALALFLGCKWLAYCDALTRGLRLSFISSIGFLFGWVGMEPTAFADRNIPPGAPRLAEWIVALARVVLGSTLIWVWAGVAHPALPILTGWIGMFGIILLLHFGTFEWLALAWRRHGLPVEPLMRSPLLAISVGEFWGARWNTGFHAMAHRFVFRPLARRVGPLVATLGVFLISGLVHELVITVPARGGFGLPTVYFLLQGTALIVERSHLGRRIGLGHGVRGRTFALVVAAAPAFWLFPPVFVHRVILPMLHAIGAI